MIDSHRNPFNRSAFYRIPDVLLFGRQARRFARFNFDKDDFFNVTVV
jgi:hypothetical protein